MSVKQIETNDVNGFQLTEQGPRPAGVFDRDTLVVIMPFLLLVRVERGLR